MINPFDKKDRELKDFQRAEEEVKKKLSSLSVIANDILSDQRYKQFSDLLKVAEENTLDLFFRFKEDDPYKFKAKADELLVELRVYRNLLASIKDLSNPKPKSNPNFTQTFKDDMKGFIKSL